MSKRLGFAAFVFLLTFSLSSCSRGQLKINRDNIKVGFIYNGAITDEGYCQAHDQGRLALVEMGIPTLYVENVDSKRLLCSDAIEDLIAEGCNVIYAVSIEFYDDVSKAADKYPDVIFGHCSGTGTKKNLTTYFGKIYQTRYLSGVVAGLKSKTGRIGYVAAHPIPECIRAINAFTIGARSVNPDIQVDVVWTMTWYDPIIEKKGALKVLEGGCDVIAQAQDTPAAQLVAQDAGIFCIGYNFAPKEPKAPAAFLTAPIFHWEKFIKEDVESILDGTWHSRQYWGGLETGVVGLADLTELCEPGTKEHVEKRMEKIIQGNLDIFSGEIYDNHGNLRVKKGESLTDDEIWSMDWFVQGVNGDLP